jgi:hypothetical protein
MQYIRGKGTRDNYLQPQEVAYRYHAFLKPNTIPDPADPTKKITKLPDTNFTINLDFGTSATLDPHRVWMLALENFATQWGIDAAGDPDPTDVSLVIKGTHQVTEKSNISSLNGTHAVFNFATTYLYAPTITNNFIGHRITDPNFLNSAIECQLIDFKNPEVKVKNMTHLSFTILVYAYQD